MRYYHIYNSSSVLKTIVYMEMGKRLTRPDGTESFFEVIAMTLVDQLVRTTYQLELIALAKLLYNISVEQPAGATKTLLPVLLLVFFRIRPHNVTEGSLNNQLFAISAG